MAHVERTITVSTPLDRVWPYLKDFRNTEEWDPPTQRTTRTSGDGGVGTTYHNVSKMLGKETEVDYTVVECVEQERLQLKGDPGGSMDLLDTMTFEATPAGGTAVTYRAEFHLHGAAKLSEPLLPLGLKKLADNVEEQMSACLERL